MSLLLLILLLALAFLFACLPVFETTFLVLLSTQVLAFLFGLGFSLSAQTYYIVMIWLSLLLILFNRANIDLKKIDYLEQCFPIAIFTFVYLIYFSLCRSWPDFIAIGERLRDYAILNSIIDNPLKANEPWMSGYSLNYYLYWYRFGHMLSSMLGLKVWETYHILIAFSFALYTTCAFVYLRTWLKFSEISATFLSLLVAMASNIAGIVFFLKFIFGIDDGNWWGPSRVIEGSINEFPAWSFLLGDAHPHYLNLSFVPLAVLALLRFYGLFGAAKSGLVLIFSMLVLIPLWIYNANAWELPIWFGMVFVFGVGFLCSKQRTWYLNFVEQIKKPRSWLTRRAVTIFFIQLLAVISLIMSSRNIVPSDDELKLVTDTVLGSRFSEFFMHWGIPLTLIAFFSTLQINNKLVRLIGFCMLAAALLDKDALMFLLVVFIFNLYRVLELNYLSKLSSCTLPTVQIVTESMGISCIALFLAPEFFFFNDAYGPEIERMNTIFKIYSANWFWAHCFAFYITRQAFKTFIVDRFKNEYNLASANALRFVQVLFLSGIFLFMGGFFYTTAYRFIATEMRLPQTKGRIVEPFAQGLSEPDAIFPGLADTVKALLNAPKGIVLEAQGNAYDYTSDISTLSGNMAFLGWANHIGLLLKNSYAEVQRREAVTKDFYTNASCKVRLEILNREGIAYAVLGPLEKRQHPEATNLDFSCLNTLLQSKEYILFTP